MVKARVAVLISGAGTNMAALHVRVAYAEDCPYEIVLVAANDPDAAGLAVAAAEGVAVWAMSHKGMTRLAFDDALDEALHAHDADTVVLAGYMRLLSDDFVESWAGRMVNIHPSLLPKYKGLDTHAAALAAGDSHGGCTVHEVTAELDSGPVLAQARVAILPGDTVDTLAARVRIAEHQLYPRTLSTFVRRDRDPEQLAAQVRRIAMAMPEAEETVSHGMPCFGIVKGKKFAWVSSDHHGDGKTALLVKISGAEEQAALIEADPAHYYRPAYFGEGWIAMRLDLGDTDWDHVADWVQRSWLSVAPKRLTVFLDAANEF